VLVAGERRLAACKTLGWTEIPVTVVDLNEVARGELAENAERKDFLPSEIDAIRRALEPIEKAAAEQRMKAGKPSGKFPEGKGEARDKIGAFAGVSGRTVEKIAKVVEAAEADPERFGKLVDQMDRTGKVNGAFNQMKMIQQAAAIRAPSPGLGGMKFAYADFPYLGCGSYYAEDRPDAIQWNDPETHRRLIERLCDEYPDGWALSLTSGSLHDILPMVPKSARVGAWVKPWCSFTPGVNPAYAWEPVIFMGGRKYERLQPTVRDWISANITMQRGVVGTKPRDFCRWVFSLFNAQPGDTFVDLFPGSGAVLAAWVEWVTAGNEAPGPSRRKGNGRNGRQAHDGRRPE
jgi:hypothetical protein